MKGLFIDNTNIIGRTPSAQESCNFAKNVCNDHNPIHDDCEKHIIPGDYLFSLFVSNFGLINGVYSNKNISRPEQEIFLNSNGIFADENFQKSILEANLVNERSNYGETISNYEIQDSSSKLAQLFHWKNKRDIGIVEQICLSSGDIGGGCEGLENGLLQTILKDKGLKLTNRSIAMYLSTTVSLNDDRDENESSNIINFPPCVSHSRDLREANLEAIKKGNSYRACVDFSFDLFGENQTSKTQVRLGDFTKRVQLTRLGLISE